MKNVLSLLALLFCISLSNAQVDQSQTGAWYMYFFNNTFKESQFGFSYNHLSNASLGTKNPGANSYMFNFLKKF